MKRLLLAAIAAVLAQPGCMDPLHNYDACVEIETARCQKRADCIADAADFEYPGFDYDTCVTYYKENCRTREMNGLHADQAAEKDVQGCIDAIRKLSCDKISWGVNETYDLPACDFLEDHDTGIDRDSGSDTDGDTDGDTDTDGDSDVDGGADAG
jgi:hypothetical protein